MIQGNPIAKQWAPDGIKMHCHLKNIRFAARGISTPIVSFGGYTDRRALAFSVYIWSDNTIHIEVTSTTPNISGGGKYYIINCNPANSDEKIEDSPATRVIFSRSKPQEIEARLENGLYEVKVDGKTYISAPDINSGTFNGSGASYPVYPYIRRNDSVSYDLVDFTYETAETSCRFVPMKTADGKDAIYEAYSQQVVEI